MTLYFFNNHHETKQKGSCALWILRGHDFRLDDNPLFNALVEASRAEKLPLLAVWCIHPDTLKNDALLEANGLRLPRLGLYRYRFQSQAAESLRKALSAYRIPLLQYVGTASALLGALAESGLSPKQVGLAASPGFNEASEEEALAKWCAKHDVTLHRPWIHTLYAPEDLPFPPENMPLGATAFRKKLEARAPQPCAPISPPAPEPIPDAQAAFFQQVRRTDFAPWHSLVPENDSLFQSPETQEPQRFHGSHAAGRARLDYYIHKSQRVRSYKSTRNGLLSDDDASRFSPWLNSGVLSPHQVVHELREHEAKHGESEETYWLFVELLWREFFQHLAAFQGRHLFLWGGLKAQQNQHVPVDSPKQNPKALAAWHAGKTGWPLVDAAMRELVQTGYTSNRARQNVASYFAKELGLDWRLGATLYEHYLLDYDVAANWGNWQYVAGVGADPRNRGFNTLKQSRDYDPQGAYLRHWLPELQQLPPGADVHGYRFADDTC